LNLDIEPFATPEHLQAARKSQLSPDFFPKPQDLPRVLPERHRPALENPEKIPSGFALVGKKSRPDEDFPLEFSS
jgi:hypothetical protein